MDKIKIYEVGGSIRNELLGLPAKDRDYSVLAPSYDAMKAHVLAIGGVIYQERPQYVSLKAKVPQLGATDFTLARNESFYTDARHPDSITPAKTIEEDLKRRDFSMNAIAREVGTATLIDPFDGQGAINAREIRAVGNAFERFTEDRLRIFRAVRFSVTLNFKLSEEVKNAINQFSGWRDYEAVKAEMLQIELWKAFSHNTLNALYLLEEFPQLAQVMAIKGLRLKPTLER